MWMTITQRFRPPIQDNLVRPNLRATEMHWVALTVIQQSPTAESTGTRLCPVQQIGCSLRTYPRERSSVVRLLEDGRIANSNGAIPACSVSLAAAIDLTTHC